MTEAQMRIMERLKEVDFRYPFDFVSLETVMHEAGLGGDALRNEVDGLVQDGVLAYHQEQENIDGDTLPEAWTMPDMAEKERECMIKTKRCYI